MSTKNSKRILEVKIKHMIDESPDTSWLGEYSQSATSEFSIDREHSLECIENDSLQKEKLVRIADAMQNEYDSINENAEDTSHDTELADLSEAIDIVFELADCDCGESGDRQRNEYRYFNPSFNYVDKNGHARPENTPEEVRKYVRQDYERMESLNRGDFCFIGISAEARFKVCSNPLVNNNHVVVISGGLWGIESDSEKSYIEETEQEQLSELRAQLKALGFSSRAISTAFKAVVREEN